MEGKDKDGAPRSSSSSSEASHKSILSKKFPPAPCRAVMNRIETQKKVWHPQDYPGDFQRMVFENWQNIQVPEGSDGYSSIIPMHPIVEAFQKFYPIDYGATKNSRTSTAEKSRDCDKTDIEQSVYLNPMPSTSRENFAEPTESLQMKFNERPLPKKKVRFALTEIKECHCHSPMVLDSNVIPENRVKKEVAPFIPSTAIGHIRSFSVKSGDVPRSSLSQWPDNDPSELAKYPLLSGTPAKRARRLTEIDVDLGTVDQMADEHEDTPEIQQPQPSTSGTAKPEVRKLKGILKKPEDSRRNSPLPPRKRLRADRAQLLRTRSMQQGLAAQVNRFASPVADPNRRADGDQHDLNSSQSASASSTNIARPSISDRSRCSTTDDPKNMVTTESNTISKNAPPTEIIHKETIRTLLSSVNTAVSIDIYSKKELISFFEELHKNNDSLRICVDIDIKPVLVGDPDSEENDVKPALAASDNQENLSPPKIGPKKDRTPDQKRTDIIIALHNLRRGPDSMHAVLRRLYQFGKEFAAEHALYKNAAKRHFKDERDK